MIMKRVDKLNVLIDGQSVGTLALMKNHYVAFQYDKNWLKGGFSLNPFSLPLTDDVFIPQNMNCQGLFGVFEDSLPDAWGTLLMDRTLIQKQISPQSIGVLDRLSYIGNNGKGDITYEPAKTTTEPISNKHTLDEIREACNEIFNHRTSDYLDELFAMGGSSGGARPKIYTTIDGEDWLIKFPHRQDDPNIGQMEYNYSQCAKRCGIHMTETRLFPSNQCAGYFGTKRFDRDKDHTKKHVSTAKALLDLPFDVPSLDYSSLLQLTDILTIHDQDDILQVFRLACFNVYAHNQDDHSKNFSFIYNKTTEKWHFAPAYDLTYSTTAYGEHTTSVNWNGRNPGKEELLAIAKKANIDQKKAKAMIEQIAAQVRHDLSEYIKDTQ